MSNGDCTVFTPAGEKGTPQYDVCKSCGTLRMAHYEATCSNFEPRKPPLQLLCKNCKRAKKLHEEFCEPATPSAAPPPPPTPPQPADEGTGAAPAEGAAGGGESVATRGPSASLSKFKSAVGTVQQELEEAPQTGWNAAIESVAAQVFDTPAGAPLAEGGDAGPAEGASAEGDGAEHGGGDAGGPAQPPEPAGSTVEEASRAGSGEDAGPAAGAAEELPGAGAAEEAGPAAGAAEESPGVGGEHEEGAGTGVAAAPHVGEAPPQPPEGMASYKGMPPEGSAAYDALPPPAGGGERWRSGSQMDPQLEELDLEGLFTQQLDTDEQISWDQDASIEAEVAASPSAGAGAEGGEGKSPGKGNKPWYRRFARWVGRKLPRPASSRAARQEEDGQDRG
mmetsp:Transcript_3165/g.11060  ORF Transcript_3165/g.11060 Transcript_3165/m.11060 type:complete len:393 (+) Transcript_3165:129-1307(+)